MPERDRKQEGKAPEEGQAYAPDQRNRQMESQGDAGASWGQPHDASEPAPARTKLDTLDEKREAERAAKQARDRHPGRATR